MPFLLLLFQSFTPRDMLLGFVALAVIAFLVWAAMQETPPTPEQANHAQSEYLRALTLLGQDPNNVAAEVDALRWGRELAKLSYALHGRDGISYYSADRVQQDVDSRKGIQRTYRQAYAPAPVNRRHVQPAYEQARQIAPIESRLTKLNWLLQRGLITQNEYQARRQRILDEV